MAWNTQQDLIKGADFNLYLVDLGTSGMTSGMCATAQVLAYATNASLEMNADTLDISSKLSCRWAANLPGNASYTVSSDALYCLAANAAANSALTIDDLFDAMLAGTNVGWVMAKDKNAGDSEKCGQIGGPDTTTAGAVYYWGEAAVSSLSISANNGEICQSSISLTGNGAPNKEVAA